jgi:hypothetical protein
VYEAELASVKENLHPLIWVIQKIRRNPVYTDTYHTKLKRQQFILETVLARMRDTKPLENRDVTLILEYNSLL